MTDLMITCAVSDWFSADFLFDFFYHHASYLFVFVFMVIESSFLPFPSEVVVPPAAYIAVSRGDMNVFLIILVATAGAVVGALINYFLAMWVGRPIVYGFANSSLGHACLIDEAKVQHAEKYFDEHGALSTFIGRLIPAVRQLISIPAGLARMNLGVFTGFTALGALVWNCILAGLGYWLGKSVPYEELWPMIQEYNHYFTIGGFVILLICVAVIVRNILKKRKTK